jgi:hypothetical protein
MNAGGHIVLQGREAPAGTKEWRVWWHRGSETQGEGTGFHDQIVGRDQAMIKAQSMRQDATVTSTEVHELVYLGRLSWDNTVIDRWQRDQQR